MPGSTRTCARSEHARRSRSASFDDDVYRRVAQLMAAANHPLRLRIFAVLLRSATSVGELAAELGASPSLVSKHLHVLREANVVATDRRGKRVVYRLAGDGTRHFVCLALSFATRSHFNDS